MRAPWQPVAVASLCLGLLAGCAQPSASSSSASPVTQTRPAPSQAPSAARILSGHHWLLQRASTAQGAEQAGWKPSGPGVEGKDVQLDFTSEGMLSVHNLCNQLAGRYTLDGNRILVEQLVSTMRACNNRSLMELEQRVAQRLAQLDSWQLRTAEGPAAPTLTLTFKDGGRWELQGKPTPATLYGSEGVREFLEVAPQREACSGVAPMQCLKVRSVQYDSRGLKTEVGPWQLFYTEIEGYRHEPGVRNVLRVQRYERKQVPADASRYVYVLDMVVESEIVKPR
ncbi:heat-shock protein [Comamonas terrigena]|uniref:Heat-shock protein n=1 Tax=Comamonas terrigena TaxID=32013 RepID=A0A2A7V0G1_COMTR|nr:META and DUF4377 domain-containing protein [Comamonas terrigena]PEH90983.1 heat-shock protein [Comamonas terrigena]